jgi:pSer/pThr/pTyr-binding forkhead associated (FHA) protein
MPDVDLSAYAGCRLGVSRKHAIIRFQNEKLDIYDLGSSNGTTVNGARLTPHEPHTLRDGDEILLGKMMVKVLFQAKRRR